MSENQISILAQNQFAALASLRKIDLSSNRINFVHREAFKNLGSSVEMIDLSNNRLQTMSELTLLSLNGLQVLETIYSLYSRQVL